MMSAKGDDLRKVIDMTRVRQDTQSSSTVKVKVSSKSTHLFVEVLAELSGSPTTPRRSAQ